ncbi:MAG: NAD(+)/NADH kinase [Pirellulales bacterium]|nr:NAD(+)/NADH kinase [Pirellulales bacterium]
MARTIALFGGSFNPPGVHHRQLAALLAAQFDEVIVVPCGPRPDKSENGSVDPIYRAAMVDMTFCGLKRVRVELFDLEASTYTPHYLLRDRFANEGEIWLAVGSDLIQGGAAGASAIQRGWQQGTRLWHEGRFVVLRRADQPLCEADLPPQARVVEASLAGSSQELRSRIFHGQPYEHLVVPRVARYIERHALYRGVPARRDAVFRLKEQRLLVVHDERNPEAVMAAARLENSNTPEPELVVVIGGDGTMLRAIRQHWRLRAPFYGVNAGHLGFLLNDDPQFEFVHEELVLHQVPLLWVETEGVDGTCREAVAFNDCWVERATGQAAWIEVKVNGEQRLPQLVADGALVATAAGSTSYARAMGATPVPLNTPVLLLVGSNVLRPHSWRPAVLPLGSQIELTTLDPVKRPLQAYVDGVSYGDVRTLRARVSNIAAAELVFAPGHDPAAKLARIQFPEL